MGHPRTFEETFHEHYAALCNYATRLVHDADVAEEIVQDLFVQLLEKKSLNKVEQIDHFLIRSVKFKCIDFLRKKTSSLAMTMSHTVESSQVVVDAESEEETEALFLYLVAKLPPKTREVFLLIRQSGLTYQEAAEKLEISVKTVEAQMSRALNKMRIALKEHGYLSLLYFTFFVK
jgi:RNA polymerase sigma-70 factor, ECF subfamily